MRIRGLVVVASFMLALSGSSVLVGLAAPPAQTVPSLPYLGAFLSDKDGKITVVKVESGSPAQQAGMQPGDLVSSINSQAVSTADQWTNVYSVLSTGAVVEFGLSRSGQLSTVRATLAARPGEQAPTRQGGQLRIERPPALQWLDSLTAQQQFDAERGATKAYQDSSGTEIVVKTTPGIVKSLDASANSLSLTANGGSASTYTVSSNTQFLGANALADFKSGDRVYISALQSNPNQAISVVRWSGAEGSNSTPSQPTVSASPTATPNVTTTPAAQSPTVVSQSPTPSTQSLGNQTATPAGPTRTATPTITATGYPTPR